MDTAQLREGGTPSLPATEIRGLDSLRFVAAATVALGHGAGLPLKDLWPDPTSLQRLIIGLHGNLFCGVAAVVVFFVISGLCIHYAAACGRPMPLRAFWIRRGVRILIPLVTAWVLARSLGPAATDGLAAVTWSVYCEIIYYAVYPLLSVAFRRWGTGRVLCGSCVVSAALIGANWGTSYYWSFGLGMTWLVAAPAWLAGCCLAEHIALRPLPSQTTSIWWWRAATLGYSVAASILMFHGPIKLGYPVLLFPFQALAGWWVYQEILHYRKARTWRILEWGGIWSYSLYLVHNMVIAMTTVRPEHALTDWIFRGTLIFVGSYVFYLVIESPSHKLARTLSQRWRSTAKIAVAPA